MKHLVLAGAGHAHALVLLQWMQSPLPDVAVTVVSPVPQAPYSGMVPGWLAGRYRFDEIVVDFPALCAAAGARWVETEVHGLDPAARRLDLADGRSLQTDVLSLNVGSTLNPPAMGRPGAHDGPLVLPLRPLSRLREGMDALQARWRSDATRQPLRVLAVGAGAAGFESLLAVLARLRALRPERAVHGTLLSRGDELLPSLAPAAQRAGRRALAAAGVELRLGTAWDPAIAERHDVILWATGAEPQAWQADAARRGSLAVGEAGFIRIDAQLRSVSHEGIFAAGDCAHWDQGHPLPKAGVYAVRQGPVLAHNLRAALAGGALRRYRPQRQFLALLATGDGRAIATRGPFSASGAWAWQWKDHIDRGFIGRFAKTRERT